MICTRFVNNKSTIPLPYMYTMLTYEIVRKLELVEKIKEVLIHRMEIDREMGVKTHLQGMALLESYEGYRRIQRLLLKIFLEL